MYYLITWHETDGNDVTVYETVTSADSEQAALDALAEVVEEQAHRAGTELESDGSEFGYYFPDEGEGGITLRSVESFPSEEAARSAMSFYHTEYAI